MQTVLLPKCNNFLTTYFFEFSNSAKFRKQRFCKNIWNEPQSKKFTLNFENVIFRKYKLWIFSRRLSCFYKKFQDVYLSTQFEFEGLENEIYNFSEGFTL